MQLCERLQLIQLIDSNAAAGILQNSSKLPQLYGNSLRRFLWIEVQLSEIASWN